MEVFTFPGISPYVSEVEVMEDCLLDVSESLIPFEQSKHFLLSMLALHESAKKNQAVKP
jgi:hypothetical protein